jgi:hypothetical protein
MHEPSVKDNRSDLVGIGGWLILVAIGQILGPLVFLVRLSNYYSKLDSYLWTKFPATFYGEAALNAFIVVIAVYTAYLFFTKSRLFPKYFVYESVAAMLLLPIDVISTSVTLSAYTAQPILALASRMITPEQGGQSLATIIITVIWIFYIKKSKRVANTFGKPMIAQKDITDTKKNGDDDLNEYARRLWPN